MTEPLRVDPAALRASATPFAEFAAEFRAVAAAMTSAMDGEGRCWGGDDAGEAFTERYAAGAESARTMLAQVPEVLEQIGNHIRRDADKYEQTDRNFGDGLGRIAPPG